MWLPNKNDTVASLDKAFLHGKIVLMNGEVKGTGIFKDFPFRVRKNAEGIYTVTVSNFKAIGVLPEGITNENNTIEVMTSSDAGIDKQAAIHTFMDNAELSVSSYPNPTSDLVNISLNNSSDNETYSIALYDINGNFIKTIEESVSAMKLTAYQFSFSKTVKNKGQYFILIKSLNDNKSALTKLLYQ